MTAYRHSARAAYAVFDESVGSRRRAKDTEGLTELTDISVITSILGVALSVATFFIGRQTAAKSQGQQDGQIMSELGYLKSNTDDIKRRLDKQDERHLDLVTRLTAVEASASEAHKRLDDFLKT